MALKYHPDKNKSATAVEQFQNIHSAYEFLLRDPDNNGNNNNNNNNNNNDGTNESLDFDSLLNMFLDTVLDDESVIFKKILGILIPKVINAIKGIDISKIRSILQPIDLTILNKIRGFFAKYAHIFEEFADFGNLSNTLNEIDNNKKTHKPDDPYNHILLHPLLEDLFQNNLYKCMENGHLLVIPLWHQELLYVLSGYEILVECYPILPDNISIDENNDIFICLEYGIMELWFMENIDIEIGGKRILIEKESLKMVEDQQIILKGEGISKINEEDIYCILEKGDIYVNIQILVG